MKRPLNDSGPRNSREGHHKSKKVRAFSHFCSLSVFPLGCVAVSQERRKEKKARRHEKEGGARKKELDMSKIKCHNCHKMGHFARDCKQPKAAK